MKLKLTDLPVVYINLDEQIDRKETLEQNLKDIDTQYKEKIN